MIKLINLFKYEGFLQMKTKLTITLLIFIFILIATTATAENETIYPGDTVTLSVEFYGNVDEISATAVVTKPDNTIETLILTCDDDVLYCSGNFTNTSIPGNYKARIELTYVSRGEGGVKDMGDVSFTVLRKDELQPNITTSHENNSFIKPGLLTFTIFDEHLDKVFINGEEANVSAITATNISIINTTGWANGIHNITIYANDTSGNENNKTFTYKIDTIQPDICVIDFPEDTISKKNFNFSLSITDNFGVGSVKAELIKPDGTSDTISLNFRDNLWKGEILPDETGEYTLTITAEDIAGNNGTKKFKFSAGENETAEGNITLILNYPQNNSFISPGTLLNFTIFARRLDKVLINGVEANISFIIATNTILIDTSVWRDGIHNIEIYAKDIHGNENLKTFKFMVDTTPPGITVIDFPDENNITVNEKYKFFLNVTDNFEVSSVKVELIKPDGTSETIHLNFRNGLWEGKIKPDEIGKYKIIITANDVVGNNRTKKFTFSVKENETANETVEENITISANLTISIRPRENTTSETDENDNITKGNNLSGEIKLLNEKGEVIATAQLGNKTSGQLAGNELIIHDNGLVTDSKGNIISGAELNVTFKNGKQLKVKSDAEGKVGTDDLRNIQETLKETGHVIKPGAEEIENEKKSREGEREKHNEDENGVLQWFHWYYLLPILLIPTSLFFTFFILQEKKVVSDLETLQKANTEGIWDELTNEFKIYVTPETLTEITNWNVNMNNIEEEYLNEESKESINDEVIALASQLKIKKILTENPERIKLATEKGFKLVNFFS